MIDFACACGAQIRAPSEAVGRRGTCRTCGQKFTVPDLGHTLGEEELVLEPESPRPAARMNEPVADPPPRRQSHYSTPSRVAFEHAREGRRQRSYGTDALLSFLTPLTPAGVAAIFGLVVVLMLTGMVPGLLSILGMIIGLGLLFAYCFEVIVETAGGEDHLPMPAGFEEWAEVLPGAFGSMIVTFGFLSLLPVGAFIALASMSASDETIALGTSITGGVSVFMLPVALMAVAMGGVSTLFRVDLLVRTILSAPLQYLSIWVMLLLAAGVQAALYLVIAGSSAAGGIGAMLLAEFIANMVSVYTLIVSMRQIGLFYRHFSDRFPWTAG